MSFSNRPGGKAECTEPLKIAPYQNFGTLYDRLRKTVERMVQGNRSQFLNEPSAPGQQRW